MCHTCTLTDHTRTLDIPMYIQGHIPCKDTHYTSHPHPQASHAHMHTHTTTYNTHTTPHTCTHRPCVHRLHAHMYTHTPHTCTHTPHHTHGHTHMHTLYPCVQTHATRAHVHTYHTKHTTHVCTHTRTPDTPSHGDSLYTPHTHHTLCIHAHAPRIYREKTPHQPAAYAEKPSYILKNFFHTENASCRSESSKESGGEDGRRLSRSGPARTPARPAPGLRSPPQLGRLYLHRSTRSHRVPSSPDGLILGNTW